jgi:glycosyltransferase involved in cell wall biosynthesis
MPRILFFSTVFPPFIEEDEIILRRHAVVEKVIAHGLHAAVALPGAVLRADIALAWFGSVYAGYMVFLARLFRKKSIVLVAGVDASRDREINYGIWLSPWKSLFVRYAYRHADRVLTVDPFLQREVIRLAEYDGRNICTIPFGFDGKRWYPGDGKERRVITVAACEDRWRMKKKGIDKIFDAARKLPDVPFQVLGIRDPYLTQVRAEIPPNVEVIEYLPRDRILPFLQRAKVYCQPSFTEGLPNALCEAMLCECIPVGTMAGGIPTAIGTAGYLVPYSDQEALVDGLRSALDAPPGRGKEARARILNEFTIQHREDALAEVLAGLQLSMAPGE